MKREGTTTRIFAFVLIGMCVLMAVGCKTTSVTPKTDTPKATDAPVKTPEKTGPEMVGNMYKTGIPIVKEKVTYNFMGLQMNNTRPSNLDETDMMKKIAEETNIEIKWDLIPQASWTEKKNLIVASRELPDAFFGPKSLSADEVQKFGSDGLLIILNDLLNEYAPNIKAIMKEYPIYESFLRSMDGNLYQLGSLTDQGFDSLISTIINKAWLDELKLPIPTTTDELYTTLKAFKDNDMNKNGKSDEIPLSFLFQEGKDLNREVKRDFRPIYYAFGCLDTPFHINISDNDEIYFTASMDEWKEATKFLAKLYAEGLVDTEVFTQDRTLLTNKLRTQKNVGAYTDYRKDNSMLLEEDQELFTFVPALKSPGGKQVWARAETSIAEGAFAITSKAKNPEVLIRWIDHCNQEEYTPQMAFGMFKPEGYNEAEALVPSPKVPGKYEVNSGSRPENVEPSAWFMTAPIAQGCTLLTKATMDKYVAEKASSVAKLKACEVYRPNLSKWPYNYPYKFSPEEIEELSLIQTDLVQYILKTQAEFIMKGGVDEGWDSYLAQLDKLGVDRYVELYRTAFERVEK